MTIERIVVGVDGSEGSSGALRWAGDLARVVGATVFAVHAYSPLEMMGPDGLDVDAAAALAQVRLRDDWCAEARAGGVDVQPVLRSDEPVHGLLAATVDHAADLLVVGRHGHRGWRDRVTGSVPAALSERADCPVVIVPGRAG